MAKTSNEVCTEALSMIGVVAEDEPMTAESFARAQAHMTDILTTLNNTKGLAFEWTIETVPDGAFLPFSRAVAGSVASAFGPGIAANARAAGAEINPRKTLYQIGIDGLREFAAPDLSDENHTVSATYY